MSKPSTPGGTASNTLLLRRQLTELTKHPVEGFSAGRPATPFFASSSIHAHKPGLVDDDNLYEWEILVIGCVDLSFIRSVVLNVLSRPPDTL